MICRRHRSLAAAAQAAPAISPQLRSALEGTVDRREIRVAVVGVFDEGETQLAGFGRVGPNDARAPDGDTAFEIGSTSKRVELRFLRGGEGEPGVRRRPNPIPFRTRK